MKLKDVLRIGWRDVRAHPKQSFLVMGVMGVIFGLIFTVNLWLQGLENTYIQQAGWATDGKVTVMATAEMNGVAGPVDSVETAVVSREEIVQDVERFGGKIVGDVRIYGTNGSVVLAPEYLTEAIEIDIDDIPEDAAPVLVSTAMGEQLLGRKYAAETNSVGSKVRSYQEFREALIGKTFEDKLGQKLVVAGLAPGSFAGYNLSFKSVEKNNTSLLNPLLEMINVSSATPFALDDDGEWTENAQAVGDVTRLIVVFGNAEQAYCYFEEGDAAFLNVERAGKKYSASTLAGMAPDTQYVFNVMRLITNIACGILAVVAVIVVIFTTIRLIDQEKRNIALYYSLGATSRQIYGIYFVYFGMLVCGAAMFALGLAFLITLIYSMLNQELLGTLFMTAFSLPEMPKVMLCAVNWELAGFLGLMFLTVPFCIFVNWKHIAGLGAEKVG